MPALARVIIGKNKYANSFKCSGTCGKTYEKGKGIYLRILLQPESKGSPDLVIFVCDECNDQGLHEGVVDLESVATSVALGPY